MKIRIISLAMAFLLLPVQLFAQGYLGGTVGQAELESEGFDRSTSFSIAGGYRLNEYFAFEATYADFGKTEPDFIDPGLDVFVEATAFDVAILGILPVTNRFEIFARAGFMSWEIDAGSGLLPDVTASIDGEDFNYGAGFSVNFNEKFSVFAGYQRYRFEAFNESEDLDNLYVGAKYYFGQGRQITSTSSPSSSYSSQSTVYEPASTYTAGTSLRAVTESEKGGCTFLRSFTAGAGGPGDPSLHTETAMNKALTQAASAGADSYYVVDIDTTASGASVVLEALKCN
jgi:OOP family OmpA-OmpF porin